MATLASQRISVTLPGGVADFLRRRAERENTSVPKTLVSVVAGVMEEDEDEISDEEDKYLSELADKAMAEQEGKPYFTMDEVWKKINAL